VSNTTPSITPKTEQREAVDNGGYAFPTSIAACPNANGDIVVHDSAERAEPGMSLRDYFAAKAMQGAMARGGPVWSDETDRRKAYANFADRMYAMADAMLRARKSGGAA